MATDFVILLPGQGSQKVGMGKDLSEAFPAARDVFDTVDAALGIALSSLMFEGPADELTLTINAQPALLTHSAAAWAVVGDVLSGGSGGNRVLAAAGHSLGEFSAYHVAGALSAAAAARIVRQRGALMYEQGVARPGTMAAIIGSPTRSVDDICAEASETAGLVVPANYNSAEQIVISGEVAGVERAMELAKEAGAKRCLPLPVSGAFHSPLMAPAAAGLAAALDAESWQKPGVPVIANVNAEPVSEAATARHLLVEQLTSPVRWTGIMQYLAATYPEATYLELGTGSVLSGLARRIAPGIKTMSCGTVAEVQAILNSHG